MAPEKRSIKKHGYQSYCAAPSYKSHACGFEEKISDRKASQLHLRQYALFAITL